MPYAESYALSFVLAFVLALVTGSLAVPLLRQLKVGQRIRADGPKAHFAKAGTPTMGGLIFIMAFCVAAIALGGAKSPRTLTAMAVAVGYGLLGFLDDFLKVVLKRPLGLRAREKLFGQVAGGIVLGLLAIGLAGSDTRLVEPFSGWTVDLGGLYVPFVTLVLIATANAVNLTDGLDGLAAGACFLSFSAYAVISAVCGLPDLAAFCLAVMGSLAGFLRYNLHPARVFMGDTGSMALGAALAAVAVLTKTELVLPLVGGLYVVEALSVILQVASFQLTGRRVFRMSPLHHHFEVGGWPEDVVVRRFWLMSLAAGVSGVAVVLIRRGIS